MPRGPWSRAIALCVVAALFGSCSTYQGSKRTAKTGGWIAVAGVPTLVVGLALADCSGGGCRNAAGSGVAAVGLVTIPLGLAIAGLGLLGMLVRESPAEQARNAEYKRAEQARLRAVQEDYERSQRETREGLKREEARGFVIKAKTAADNGDCTTAAMLARRVQTLDDELYRNDLSKHPAVAACFVNP